MIPRLFVLGLVLLAPVSGALADDPLPLKTSEVMAAQPPAAAPDEAAIWSSPKSALWTVRIQPRVWYVGPAGDLNLPGAPPNTPSYSLADLNTDSPRMSPYVDLTIREPKSGWFFTVSGVGVSIAQGSTAPVTTNIGTLAVTAGDSLQTNVEWNTFQFYMGKPFKFFDFGDKTADNSITFSWIAGLRTHDQSFTISGPGGTINSDKFFIEAIGGVKMNVQLLDRFSAEVDFAIGGCPTNRSVLSLDVAVGFIYRPTDAIGIHAGYRLLEVNASSGSGVNEYKYNGSLAGLYAGVSIRF